MANAPLWNSVKPADIDKIIPEEWRKSVLYTALRKTFFYPFTGKPEQQMAIVQWEDFKAHTGDTVHIPMFGRVYGEGVKGDETLVGKEGKFYVGETTVTLDFYRNAVAINERARYLAVTDVLIGVKNGISNWAKVLVDDLLFEKIFAAAPVIYQGTASSDDDLTADTILTFEDISRAKLQLIRLGAEPIRVHPDKGGEIPVYVLVITPEVKYHLRRDNNWKTAIQNIAERGNQHPLFTGAIGEWDGVVIFEFNPDFATFKGSYIRPETILAEDASAGATEITVGIKDQDGNLIPDNWTKYFPSSGKLQIGSEIVTYSAKTATTFTVSALANDHSAGELVTLPYGRAHCLMFGANTAALVWGEPPRPIADKFDYGFVSGLGVELWVGAKEIRDVHNVFRSAISLHCSAPLPSGVN